MGVRICFDSLKISFTFIQNCCCIIASFTTSRMNNCTLSLHWSCLCWRCYHLISDQLQADSIPPSWHPNQCLCCSTGLKLSWPKTKLQNVGAGDLSSTILIDHGSYAVLPTIDRLQLGWLTRGVVLGVGRFLPPESMLEGSEYVLISLKILHSFIQNCCCITASFTASHWSCLCWRCYHPYIWSAPSRQCPPIALRTTRRQANSPKLI